MKLAVLICSAWLLWQAPAAGQPAGQLDSLRQLVREQAASASPATLLPTAREYLASAKAARNRSDIIAAYRTLATLYHRLGDEGKALRYFRLYILEAEKQQDIEMRKNAYFEKKLYENEIVALAIQLDTLKAQNERLRRIKADYQRKNRYIYLGLQAAGGLLLLLLGTWGYRKWKAARHPEPETGPAEPDPLAVLQEENRQLQTRLERLETELDLADILGQHLVPKPPVVFQSQKFVRQKFLLHLPRKLSSGDGLYLHCAKQHNLLVVYEPPGQDIAAALFNARLYHLLDELAARNNIWMPNLLLDRLEAALRQEFPAGMPFAEGLAIGACLYDSREKLLSWAGAGLDLFVVRQGILNILRGRPAPLAGQEDSQPFELAEEAVQRGMHCYLSTNGYWQQTGGKEARPLGREAFEKALESMARQPIKDQAAVLQKILLDWKGSRPQDDDILVVGFGC